MQGMHLAGIEALCRRMYFLHVPEGGMVLRQGDVGDSMYMVYKGACHIYSRYGSTLPQAGAFTP
jgi:CRP-like cAMP-binding protein